MMNSRDKTFKIEAALNEAVIESKSVKEDLMNARKYELQYIRNPQAATSQNVRKNAESIQMRVSNLKGQFEHEEAFSTIWNEIDESTAEYLTNFNQLEVAYSEAGYSSDSGPRGLTNEKGGAFRKLLEQSGSQETLDQFDSLRNLDYMYFSTKSELVLTKHSANAEAFESLISSDTTLYPVYSEYTQVFADTVTISVTLRKALQKRKERKRRIGHNPFARANKFAISGSRKPPYRPSSESRHKIERYLPYRDHHSGDCRQHKFAGIECCD